jgi:hypothetical protein
MTQDEDALLTAIMETRAEQIERYRSGVPEGVQLGTLTSTIRDKADWSTEDQFPSDQVWADEVERILSFTQVQGPFEHYLGRLRGRARQRISALAELRVAFFFSRNEFRVVEWEPIGANNREGEFTIRTPAGTGVFVEVKGPSWEAELSHEERASGRKQMPKYLHAEARWVGSWIDIRSAVDKAYGKFRSDTPNLLIIADDLFVGLEYGTGLNVGLELYEPRHGGHFTNISRQNLGGVGIFCIKRNHVEVWYEMKLFLNPYALPAVAIPEQFARAFNAVDHIDQ